VALAFTSYRRLDPVCLFKYSIFSEVLIQGGIEGGLQAKFILGGGEGDADAILLKTLSVGFILLLGPLKVFNFSFPSLKHSLSIEKFFVAKSSGSEKLMSVGFNCA